MAVTPQIVMLGLRPFLRDLKGISAQAPREVRTVVKEQLQPMLAVAKANAPGTGVTIGGRWRVSVRGAQGSLINDHPGVRPWEFGGTIAPRGVPITFEAAHMIYGPGGAIDATKDRVERGLLAAFERMARAHGW